MLLLEMVEPTLTRGLLSRDSETEELYLYTLLELEPAKFRLCFISEREFTKGNVTGNGVVVRVNLIELGIWLRNLNSWRVIPRLAERRKSRVV